MFRSLRSRVYCSIICFLSLHLACSCFCPFFALLSAFYFRFRDVYSFLRVFNVDLIWFLANLSFLLLFWRALVFDFFFFVMFVCGSHGVCLCSYCVSLYVNELCYLFILTLCVTRLMYVFVFFVLDRRYLVWT